MHLLGPVADATAAAEAAQAGPAHPAADREAARSALGGVDADALRTALRALG